MENVNQSMTSSSFDNMKLLSLLRYRDYLIFYYDKENEVMEQRLKVPCKLYHEYIVGDITLKEINKKYLGKMKTNCIGDIILVELYQTVVPESVYNTMFELIGDKEKVVKEFFKQNMFSEESGVLLVGAYTQQIKGIDFQGYVT